MVVGPWLTRILVLLAGSGASSSIALADDRANACATGAEEAQALRADGKLRTARERLMFCSRADCPAAVRADCETWLAEIDAALPLVVISARDSTGGYLTRVRTYVDGVIVTEQLDGRAIPIDPGPHQLRFEAPPNEPVEQQVLILERDKDRRLEVQFGVSAAPKAPPKPEPSDDPGGLPLLAIVSGASGIAAVGVFSVLAITGQREVNSCRDQGGCTTAEVDALRNKRIIAWTTLGVGAIALGIATVSGLRARSAPRRSTQTAAYDLQIELGRRTALELELDWDHAGTGRDGYKRVTYKVTPVIDHRELMRVQLHVGIGGAIYGDPNHTDVAVRAPLGLAVQFRRLPLEVYGEVALQQMMIERGSGRRLELDGGLGGRLQF